LVHGLLDRAASFDRAARALDDVEVLVYDRRGCASSAHLGIAHRGLVDHVDDLVAIVEAHRSGPAVVVGHSFGGQVAVLTAMRRPDLVCGVGAFETAQHWEDWWPEPHRSLVRDSNPPERRSTDDPAEQERRAMELATCAADKASIATAPYDLDELDVPLLLGWGAESMRSAVLGYHTLAARRRLRTFEVASAGHMAHRTHPEEFARFVRAALAGTRTL
jgi:pimeloyl-ACP methyl ester carboxylesterase